MNTQYVEGSNKGPIISVLCGDDVDHGKNLLFKQFQR